jgi:hypothetical protein
MWSIDEQIVTYRIKYVIFYLLAVVLLLYCKCVTHPVAIGCINGIFVGAFIVLITFYTGKAEFKQQVQQIGK